MENEQKKSNNHRNIYAAVAVILLLVSIYCAVRGCGNDAESLPAWAAWIEILKT